MSGSRHFTALFLHTTNSSRPFTQDELPMATDVVADWFLYVLHPRQHPASRRSTIQLLKCLFTVTGMGYVIMKGMDRHDVFKREH